jgi:trk system potassium uptake protein TrkA
MFAVIVGCGRLGSRVATELSKAGDDVVVVDRDKNAFGLLPEEFGGFQVLGDATDHELLVNAKIAEADTVAAVTDNDNLNLMIAQIAKDIYGTRHVLARVGDLLKGEVFEEMGVRVLCPTKVSADAFGSALLRSERNEPK